MSDFKNRIDVQRAVLQAVNERVWMENLFGLSGAALDRWEKENPEARGGAVALKLRALASALRFLANKSQEQITEDYRTRSLDVDTMLRDLRELLNSH